MATPSPVPQPIEVATAPVTPVVVPDNNTTVSNQDPAAQMATDNTPGTTTTNQATGTASSPGIAAPNTVATPNPPVTWGTLTAQNSASMTKFDPSTDWRVRISLAPNSNYLYGAPNPGILQPLVATNGVIFPYSPSIGVTYSAHYDSGEVTHSNYRSYTYKNSSVESININGTFTAQDTTEANYMLAVIHFFRSASKMFYGQDKHPKRGIPPPLLYLSGYGAYQFDQHPMVLTSFTYNLPDDVDYISSSISTTNTGVPVTAQLSPVPVANTTQKQNALRALSTSFSRLTGSQLQPGATPQPPTYLTSTSIQDASRVPTKIQIQLSFLPIISRYTQSNQFSLSEYATGKLLRGSRNAQNGGGIW